VKAPGEATPQAVLNLRSPDSFMRTGQHAAAAMIHCLEALDASRRRCQPTRSSRSRARGIQAVDEGCGVIWAKSGLSDDCRGE
jgi:hypothetical protein